MSEDHTQGTTAQPGAEKPAAPSAAKSESPADSVPVTRPIAKTPAEIKPAGSAATPPAAKIPAAPAPANTAPAPAAPAPATPAPTTTPIALVVDDEPANRDFLMRLLEQAKLEVKGASEGQEALDVASKYEEIALLVIDHKLPDMNGVDLIAKMRARYPNACVIMATMLDERSLMEQAFTNGCNVFLVKPHGFMELFRRLQEVGPDPVQLNRMIIDQYGPRPFRG